MLTRISGFFEMWERIHLTKENIRPFSGVVKSYNAIRKKYQRNIQRRRRFATTSRKRTNTQQIRRKCKKRGHANRHSLYLRESELIKNCGQDLPNDSNYYGKDHRSQASAAL